MTETEPRPDPLRAKLGAALFAIGIAMILWGVLHVAEAARGDQPLAPEFAQRRSYNQVKEAVHSTFPGGLMRGLAGLIVTMLGARMFRSYRQPPADPLQSARRLPPR